MSRNRRHDRQAAYEKRTGSRAGRTDRMDRAERLDRNRGLYVYGTAAYEQEPERQWEAEPRRQVHPAVQPTFWQPWE